MYITVVAKNSKRWLNSLALLCNANIMLLICCTTKSKANVIHSTKVKNNG
jgi:hypothetical protein